MQYESGILIKMINLDIETHAKGRRYVNTERRQTSTSPGEKPGIDPSLTDFRKIRPGSCLDLRLLVS